jgi:hypothetical protein
LLDSRGLYVTNRSAAGFEVREQQGIANAFVPGCNERSPRPASHEIAELERPVIYWRHDLGGSMVKRYW